MLQTNICKLGITTANKNISCIYVKQKQMELFVITKLDVSEYTKPSAYILELLREAFQYKTHCFHIRYIFTCAEICKLNEM